MMIRMRCCAATPLNLPRTETSFVMPVFSFKPVQGSRVVDCILLAGQPAAPLAVLESPPLLVGSLRQPQGQPVHTRIRPADSIGYGESDEKYGSFISQAAYRRTQQTVQVDAMAVRKGSRVGSARRGRPVPATFAPAPARPSAGRPVVVSLGAREGPQRSVP